MKTIVHPADAREQILHIETQGCVINIRVGLTDNDGNPVTHVSITTDGDDEEGKHWTIPPDDPYSTMYRGIRVIGKPIAEPEPALPVVEAPPEVEEIEEDEDNTCKECDGVGIAELEGREDWYRIACPLCDGSGVQK